MKLKATLTPIQLMNTEQLRLIWNSKKKTLGLTQEKVAQFIVLRPTPYATLHLVVQ